MKARYWLLLFVGMTPLATLAADPACHRLMTEKECLMHHATLAALPPGAARDHYLAEFAQTRKEREMSCGCAHPFTASHISQNGARLYSMF
jgi:hypothetical protein